MNDYKHLKTEVDDRVFIITINRPDVLNALSPETNFELADAFDHFEKTDDLWVAIITGTGNKAFSAGGDIASMNDAKLDEDYPIPNSGYGGITNRFSCDKPIIAAVNGLAMGGGFETALACDLIVASEEAIFGLPEPRIGVAAVGSGMHRLARNIGLKPAMDLLLTARSITAKEALDLHIINKVVPGEHVMQSARDYAKQILKSAPLAIRATKHCTMHGLGESSLQAAMQKQNTGCYEPLEAMLKSDDTQEGLAAFMEKRKPVWKAK